jgi:DNA-binding transcriptional LysR family regulator
MRIVPLLGSFRMLHPDLKVECVFTDDNVDPVAERIDLAVRLALTAESDMIDTKLTETRCRMVGRPGHLAERPPFTVPADLRTHDVRLFKLRACRTRWLMRDAAGRVEAVLIEGDITLPPPTASLLPVPIAGLGPALPPTGWRSGPSPTEALLTGSGSTAPRSRLSTPSPGLFIRAAPTCRARSGP